MLDQDESPQIRESEETIRKRHNICGLEFNLAKSGGF